MPEPTTSPPDLTSRVETASTKLGRFAVAVGGIFNSGIQFLTAVLGPGSGKLISIIIVCVALTMTIWSFVGQIRTVPNCGDKCTPVQLEQKRITYKDAITSVGMIIGIMVGAFPTLIMLGTAANRLAANGMTLPGQTVPTAATPGVTDPATPKSTTEINYS